MVISTFSCMSMASNSTSDSECYLANTSTCKSTVTVAALIVWGLIG